MTIDELRQLADEGDAIDWYGPGSRFTEPLREAADILASRDAEIESLRSQLASAWAVIHRQHDSGLRDKPEVSMERADLDAAIAGVCASRDAEIWRLLHGWQADAARCDELEKMLLLCSTNTGNTCDDVRHVPEVIRLRFEGKQRVVESSDKVVKYLQRREGENNIRIADLERENAALRKDAERYRWLRVRPLYFEEPLSPEELDAHVDAELKHE